MNDRSNPLQQGRGSGRAEAVHTHPTRDVRVAGRAVTGPAFYIWDEDPRHARQWGAELADAWLASHARPRQGEMP